MASRFLRSCPSARAVLLCLPLIALAACGSKETDNLSALDAELANDMSDPALRGALEDQIAVDPDLVGQSNGKAIRPADAPPTGAVPVLAGDAKAAAAEAQRLAGGRLDHAPAPAGEESCDDCATRRPQTLGALAREQGKLCGTLKYGMGWAERLPAALPLYPGAKLMEAAGAEGGGCGLRVVSFVSAVPKQGVIDFYYTLARRGGYDAEHRLRGGEHVLGGTRAKDGAAYFITFADAPGGGTAVDLVASNGR